VYHRVAGRVPVGASRHGLARRAAALAAAVLALGGTGVTVATAARATGSPTPVLLASGSSAYPEQTQVLGASSGGYVVEGLGRDAAGGLAVAPVVYAATWKAKGLTALPVPTPGTTVTNPAADVSIAGSMVSVLETSLTAGRRPTVFMDDLATGATAAVTLPPGRGWNGAAPNGYLANTSSRDGTATTTSALEVAESNGAVVTLGTTTGVDPTFFAGPNDVIATVWDSSAKASTIIEYVPYSSPGTWQMLADTSGRWTCTSATGASVGCFHVAGRNEALVDNYSLTGGALLEEVVNAPLARFRVLVTPQVTSWSSCGSHGCTLTRLSDSGTTTSSTPVPTGFLATGAGEIVWGTAGTDASSSGVFSMNQTASSPSQLVPAPLAPLAAAVVSVTNGSVSWVDNGSAGLGVWRKPVAVRSGRLVVGAASLLGSVGFAGAGAPAPGVSLTNDGAAVAFTTDNPAGARWPVGLAAVETATGARQAVTGQANGSLADVVGDPISSSGLWVEWQRGTTCELYDLATRRTLTPALPGAVACLVGDGHLAWLTSSGALEVLALTSKGLVRPTRAVEVVPAKAGIVVSPGAHLFLGSGDVGWDFSWTAAKGSTAKPGSESGYRVFTSPKALPAFLVGGLHVVGITGSDVAFEGADGANPSVRVISSGQEVTLAPYASCVSLGGDLVAWVGADGLPRVEALPG